MAIISVPSDFVLPEDFTCAFCNEKITLENASAGPVFNGEQQFICQKHLSGNLRELVLSWVDYSVTHASMKQTFIEEFGVAYDVACLC